MQFHQQGFLLIVGPQVGRGEKNPAQHGSRVIFPLQVLAHFTGQRALSAVSAELDSDDIDSAAVAEAIRDRDLLHWFPGRTITDLYLWISENRSTLEKELGWETQSDIAATDLILERSAKSEPGSWRKARTVARYTDTVFTDILVPLSGFKESWDALDQAILIAKRENAKLHGLHIVETYDDAESADALNVKARFEQTCKEANVKGQLAVDVGDVTQRISERAVLTDLIVVGYSYDGNYEISAACMAQIFSAGKVVWS